MRSTAAVLLAATGLTACTRVVDLGLPEGPRQLVVEARIELGSPVQQVRLSTTDAFGAAGPPPPAVGAVVTVRDDAGAVVAFPETSVPGTYRAAMSPAAGRRYTLTIDWEGERYQAVQTLVTGPPIDDLYFIYVEKGIAQGDSGFRAVIDYTDPPGVANYYLWELFVDGIRRIKVDPGNRFRIISSDEFYDGGTVIGYQPYDEEVVEPGDQVRVRQVALSEEAYRYYFVLFEQTTGGGGPFSTPPASVRGNVANLTDPAHRALGFFLAGSVSERVAVPPPR